MRNDRITRRALIGTGVAAGLFAGQAARAEDGRRAGGTLRIAAEGPLGPGQSALSPAMALGLTGTIFETLTELSPDGTLKGALAERWYSDAEARNWTFVLRSSLTTSNGPAPRASDIVRRLEEARKTAIEPAALLADLRVIRAIDDRTLRITLGNPNPGFPLFLSAPSLAVNPDRAAAYGMGSYRRISETADRLVLMRDPGTYEAGFDRIEVLAEADPAARTELLAIGRVDLAVDVPPDALPDLRRRGRIRVVREENAIETVLRADGPDAAGAAALLRTAARRLQAGGQAPGDLSVLSEGTDIRLSVLGRNTPASEDVARALAVPLGDPRAARRYLADLDLGRHDPEAMERVLGLGCETVLERRDRFTLASSRLAHGPRLSASWGLDGSRVAQRWWWA